MIIMGSLQLLWGYLSGHNYNADRNIEYKDSDNSPVGNEEQVLETEAKAIDII